MTFDTLDYSILHQAAHHFNTEYPVKDTAKARTARALKLILEASSVARKEGLLALEEHVTNKAITDYPEDSFFKSAILYIVDGTDPDIVDRLLRTKLSVMDQKSLDTYICYLIMNGCLLIQVGMNPRIIEEQLYCAIPQSVLPNIKKSVQQELTELSEQYKQVLAQRWDELEQQNTDNPFLCLFEEKAKKYTDKDIQRILRDFDVMELASLLVFCSQDIKQKFSKNLSVNVKANIMDELWSLYDGDLTCILSKLLKLCNKLEDMGEITYNNIISLV